MTPEDNCSCSPSPAVAGKGSALSLAGGLIIALLPKCPFCVLAYSSAATMCSGAMVYDHQPGWFSYVSIVLSLIVTGTILHNYRGPRSAFALALAVTGGAMIATAELLTGQLGSYHAGAWLLLAGAVLNGGLVPVLRSLRRRFSF